MARVIWDGEKIVIDSTRLNIEEVESVSKKYDGRKLPMSTYYEFPRSKDSIKAIGAISGIIMDDSFKKLYDIVIRKEEEKKKAFEEKIASYNFPETLYPFQKQAVAEMIDISSERNILLASQPGCGKTCMASIYLEKKENSFPCLIVCPASLKVNWSKELEKWIPGHSICIVNGRDSYADSAVRASAEYSDIVIINYDILGYDDKEASKREKERIAKAKEEGRKYRKAFIPVKGWAVEFSKNFKFATIILDECQYIQSTSAIRSRAVIQVCADKRIRKVFLSGTPFETKVRQFYNSCHILAPDLFPSEGEFLFRYCNPKKGYFGWTFDGVSNLDELRRKLSYFMIRHRKEDVLTQLPPKQKIPIYFDMDASVRKKYDDMENELLSKKDKIHQFTYLAEMKKVLMEVKKDISCQYVRDMLEMEDKFVIFVYHVEMYEYLMEKFKDIAVGINGGVSPLKRQSAVEKFQKDSKVRLFVGQISAAGTGLTLTASHALGFAEWGQTPAQMEQASDRIHRLSQEADSCQVYYLIIKDTIDEGPLKLLESHFSDIDKVLDGGTGDTLVDCNEMMVAYVKKKKMMKKKEAISIEYC